MMQTAAEVVYLSRSGPTGNAEVQFLSGSTGKQRGLYPVRRISQGAKVVRIRPEGGTIAGDVVSIATQEGRAFQFTDPAGGAAYHEFRFIFKKDDSVIVGFDGSGAAGRAATEDTYFEILPDLGG